MSIRIAVVDPLPLFQQGVSAVLSIVGHVTETPDDLVAWIRRTQSPLILLTVRSESDWELLDSICHDAACVVIAVVEGDPAVSGVRAIRSGARSVLLRDAPPETLRHVVEATMSGQVVMPPVVTDALVSAGKHETLSMAELVWLRRLAAGVTVAELASDVGYSERAMYRMLRGVYQRMGVRTRLEAIMRAQDSGWL